MLVKDTGEMYKFEERNPFVSEESAEEVASCGYCYRRWTLNEEDKLSIIVRCELDAVIHSKGEDQMCW